MFPTNYYTTSYWTGRYWPPRRFDLVDLDGPDWLDTLRETAKLKKEDLEIFEVIAAAIMKGLIR